jgi:hypothetical protein
MTYDQAQGLASDDQLRELYRMYSNLTNARRYQNHLRVDAQADARPSLGSDIAQKGCKMPPPPQRFVRKHKSRGDEKTNIDHLPIISHNSSASSTKNASANTFEELYDLLFDSVMHPPAEDQTVHDGCENLIKIDQMIREYSEHFDEK